MGLTGPANNFLGPPAKYSFGDPNANKPASWGEGVGKQPKKLAAVASAVEGGEWLDVKPAVLVAGVVRVPSSWMQGPCRQGAPCSHRFSRIGQASSGG